MNLEELVAAYLEQRDDHPAIDVAEFCAQHPARAAELRLAIEEALRAEAMFVPLPAAVSDMPRRVGDYELVRELGRGGMGVVFEARRAGVAGAESVAVKVLPMAGLMGERALQRFQREARILGRLDHPQIVTAVEFGSEADTPFLVMSLVDGRGLDELVGDVSTEAAVELVASLARTVQAAHDQGVLHRDIKPHNVIVRDSGIPVLLDFGLVAADGEVTITSSGDVVGTPRYMSPEQARGEHATERSDVHALGLLLFELLTGRPAFAQSERNALLQAISSAGYVHSSHGTKDLPIDLVRVVRKSLAWNPKRRYASAAELANDLDRFVSGEAVTARSPGPVVRVIDHVAQHPTATAFSALGLALLLLLTFGVVLPELSALEVRRRAVVATWFDRGVAHWAGARGESQRTALEQALALDPGHAGASALSQLGNMHEVVGGEAEREVLAGIELEEEQAYAEAREHYAAALALAPGSPWVVVLLARSAQHMGKPELAEADLVAGSRRLPDSLAIAQELGNVLYRRRDYERAEAEYRRALEMEPEWANLWQGLAVCLFRLKDDEGALHATQRSIELAGQLDPKLANTMAALLDRMQRPEEAQALFRRLVEEHPENPTYHFNLAFSLDSQALVREARGHYEKVLELHPGQVQATVCLSWLLLTATDEELRDVALAEELLLKSLEVDRGNSPILVRGVEDFARHGGRVGRLAERISDLAREGDVDERAVRLERLLRVLEELRD